MVVVPSIWRFPLITTVPVLSPTAAGSIWKVAGPARVPIPDVPPVNRAPYPVVFILSFPYL